MDGDEDVVLRTGTIDVHHNGRIAIWKAVRDRDVELVQAGAARAHACVRYRSGNISDAERK